MVFGPVYISIPVYSEGHVENVQPIKCMIFILICNKYNKGNNKITEL
jgi:hypothetical protein